MHLNRILLLLALLLCVLPNLYAQTDESDLAVSGRRAARSRSSTAPTPEPKRPVTIRGIKITPDQQRIETPGIRFLSAKNPESPQLTPASQAVLKQLASFLSLDDHQGLHVRIEAYTDTVGSDQENTALTDAQANAVRAWLVAQGIPEGRLEAVGKGDHEPLVKDELPINQQKNRRVVFAISGNTPPPASPPPAPPPQPAPPVETVPTAAAPVPAANPVVPESQPLRPAAETLPAVRSTLPIIPTTPETQPESRPVVETRPAMPVAPRVSIPVVTVPPGNL